ncbi:hypothetical protein SH668x_002957 [Planctomicrobium sp. SH668]|uniref:hypothetical protein n=1 Tax=Planctomicrobium sp. SH668 TaxID=3448126 RepID=UPI003F5B4FD6
MSSLLKVRSPGLRFRIPKNYLLPAECFDEGQQIGYDLFLTFGRRQAFCRFA